MELQELKKLIIKFNAGKATDDEKAFVEKWFESVGGPETELSEAQLEVLKEKIRFKLDIHIDQDFLEVHDVETKKRWMSWAAVLMITLGVSLYFYMGSSIQHVDEVVSNKVAPDIQPGGNKATLTLADGNQFILNDLDTGVLISEGNITIQKTQDGQLVYEVASSAASSSNVKLNTISTPRGGQYHIILADGTKVWLNSTSSLKFPSEFNGIERNVELSGEAYFEVAKNKNMPFLVKIGDTKVEVLGTHFNIMAYADEENQETTLLEGSVKVSVLGSSARVLLPGQQARIGKDPNVIEVVNVDIERIAAWKNGYFKFNRSSIKEVMDKFARWYDIEVVYEGKIPQDEFVGTIRREVTLSQALNILKLSKVQFQMEGRKISIGE